MVKREWVSYQAVTGIGSESWSSVISSGWQKPNGLLKLLVPIVLRSHWSESQLYYRTPTILYEGGSWQNQEDTYPAVNINPRVAAKNGFKSQHQHQFPASSMSSSSPQENPSLSVLKTSYLLPPTLTLLEFRRFALSMSCSTFATFTDLIGTFAPSIL